MIEVEIAVAAVGTGVEEIPTDAAPAQARGGNPIPPGVRPLAHRDPNVWKVPPLRRVNVPKALADPKETVVIVGTVGRIAEVTRAETSAPLARNPPTSGSTICPKRMPWTRWVRNCAAAT